MGGCYLTLVSMSVSSRLVPLTSSSMFWPHTRPIWSSRFRRSTQSAMFLKSFPSRSQVNKCWKHKRHHNMIIMACLDTKDTTDSGSTSTLYWNLSIMVFIDAAYSFLCTVEAQRHCSVYFSQIELNITVKCKLTVNWLCTRPRQTWRLRWNLIHNGIATATTNRWLKSCKYWYIN